MIIPLVSPEAPGEVLERIPAIADLNSARVGGELRAAVSASITSGRFGTLVRPVQMISSWAGGMFRLAP